MGSYFSIYNDTKEDVWVDYGVNKVALYGGLGAGLAVVTLGASAVAGAVAAGTTAAGAAFVGTMEGVVFTSLASAGLTATAVTALGLTAGQLAIIGTVSGLLGTGVGLAGVFDRDTQKKIDKARGELKLILQTYERIRPGETYTCPKSTLSLCLTAYVIRDSGEMKTGTVWTGVTDGSTIEYNVSDFL